MRFVKEYALLLYTQGPYIAIFRHFVSFYFTTYCHTDLAEEK